MDVSANIKLIETHSGVLPPDVRHSVFYLSDFGQSIEVLSICGPHGPVFGAMIPEDDGMSPGDKSRLQSRIAETLGGQVQLTPGELRTVVAFRSGDTIDGLDGGERPSQAYIFALGTRLDSEVTRVGGEQLPLLISGLKQINSEAQVADEGERLRITLPIGQKPDIDDQALEHILKTLSGGVSMVHSLGLRVAGEDDMLNALLSTDQDPVFSLSVRGVT